MGKPPKQPTRIDVQGQLKARILKEYPGAGLKVATVKSKSGQWHAHVILTTGAVASAELKEPHEHVEARQGQVDALIDSIIAQLRTV